jgi:hypothetical protein
MKAPMFCLAYANGTTGDLRSRTEALDWLAFWRSEAPNPSFCHPVGILRVRLK